MSRALLLIAILCLAQCVLGTFPVTPKHLKEKNMAKRAPDDICLKIACESGGGTCGLSSNTYTGCTGEHMYCNMTSITTGKCVPAKANGVSCDDDDECISGWCNSDVCSDPYKSNGESCSTSSQCISGICTNEKCEAKASGASCTDDSQCAYEYYCSFGITTTCAAKVPAGSDCAGHPSSCQGFMVCSATTSTCVLPFTAAEGAKCAGDSECVEGTACAASSDGTYTCVDAPSSSFAACEGDSDCTGTETCECNAKTGSSVCVNSYLNNPKGVASKAHDLSDCVVQKCTGSLSDDACLEMCKSPYCAYEDTVMEAYDETINKLYPSCYFDAIVKRISQCNGASTTVLSAAAATVAAVVFALCTMV